MRVRVQSEPFDPGSELTNFAKAEGNIGAVVSFTGVVRNDGDSLDYMEIEHYPAMTKAAIDDMVGHAIERWQLADCLVIHRYGALKPGAQIMMVATAAAHRVAAFEAAEYLMDYLKSRAPFWKKEFTKDGQATWVDAKVNDEDALARWG